MTKVITSESIYQIHGLGLRLAHSMDTCFTIKNNVRKELADEVCIFEVKISKGTPMSWQVSLQAFLRLCLGLDLYHIPSAHLPEVPTGLFTFIPVTQCSQQFLLNVSYHDHSSMGLPRVSIFSTKWNWALSAKEWDLWQSFLRQLH